MTSTPDLTGKSILVTGANTGIGRVTAVTLAKRGATLTLAGRSLSRTEPVLEEIRSAGGKASFLELDLGDLTAVARSAKTFLNSGVPLHVLVNNAGIAGQRGLTKDGFELTFGTNQLGPFLFTKLLLPLVAKAENPRIVNVASRAHKRVDGINFDVLKQPTKTVTGFPEYCVSKLANILFTKELARGKAPSHVHNYCLHPGAVASDIFRRLGPFSALLKLFLISNEEGAQTSIHCASSPDVASDNGLYYDKCTPRNPSAAALDEALAKRLWDYCEEAVLPFTG
ncbi:MAG: SDR family oxidoreductase [Polyangiaceae bacterium]|nr:SDR family oxidoreductase [Polyangiaceae bacterium]